MRLSAGMAVLVTLLAAAPVAAEERTVFDHLTEELAVFGEAARLKLDVLDLAPNAATVFFADDFETYSLGFNVDYQRRRANVRLGLGSCKALAFQLHANVVLDRGAPRIKARLDLGVAGHGVSLKLPDVRVVPRFVKGRLVMEYQVPLLEGRF